MAKRGQQAQSQLLRLHRHAQVQNAGDVWPQGREREAAAVPPLQHAAGDRGRLHPGRAEVLHDLQDVLPADQGRRGRSQAGQEEGRPGAGAVRQLPSAQPRAEDRSDGRALPRVHAPQDRRAGEGDGRDQLARARGALQAGVRQVHCGEGLHRHQDAGGVLGHGAARRGRRVHRSRDEPWASGRRNCQSGSRPTSSRC